MHADVDTAIVFAADMERLAAWYREGFDLDEPQRSPGHIGFRLPGLYLGFDQATGEFGHPSAVTLWFRVDDAEAAFERLTSLGAAIRYPPTRKPWGELLAAVYDPEGNVVGLSERRAD
jgi:uncharacterized glyoxalase superfamily protein PhnB